MSQSPGGNKAIVEWSRLCGKPMPMTGDSDYAYGEENRHAQWGLRAHNGTIMMRLKASGELVKTRSDSGAEGPRPMHYKAKESLVTEGEEAGGRAPKPARLTVV